MSEDRVVPARIVMVDGLSIADVRTVAHALPSEVALWWRGGSNVDVFAGAGALGAPGDGGHVRACLVAVPALGRAPSVLARELTAITVLDGATVELVLDCRGLDVEVVIDTVEILCALAHGAPATYVGATASITCAPNLPGPPAGAFCLTVVGSAALIDVVRARLSSMVERWVEVPDPTSATSSPILEVMIFDGHNGAGARVPLLVATRASDAIAFGTGGQL